MKGVLPQLKMDSGVKRVDIEEGYINIYIDGVGNLLGNYYSLNSMYIFFDFIFNNFTSAFSLWA